MGSGKSTVARILGQRLCVPVADLDALLEALESMTIPEFFRRSGEAAFRRHEGEALERALASGAGVLACGGGVVLDPAHRAMLRRLCRTVWLEVAPDEAERRVRSEGPTRPLIEGGGARGLLQTLLAERAPLYAEAAEIRISTDARTPVQVADAVLEALGKAAA
jgi:shikimate kinase